MLLQLTDDELSVVMDAAKPLLPEARSRFLERIVAELAVMSDDERGVGTVARLCRTLQAEHHHAPALDEKRRMPTKWSRSNSRKRAAVGVSGVHATEDAQIAQAGADALKA